MDKNWEVFVLDRHEKPPKEWWMNALSERRKAWKASMHMLLIEKKTEAIKWVNKFVCFNMWFIPLIAYNMQNKKTKKKKKRFSLEPFLPKRLYMVMVVVVVGLWKGMNLQTKAYTYKEKGKEIESNQREMETMMDNLNFHPLCRRPLTNVLIHHLGIDFCFFLYFLILSLSLSSIFYFSTMSH